MIVSNLATALAPHCQVRVYNTAKRTPVGRPLVRGIWAQATLMAGYVTTLATWRPDIVHIHTCSYLNFWRSGLYVGVAKLLNRRVVLYIQGGQFHEFLRSLGPWRAWAARRVFSLVDRVLVLGEESRRLLGPWCGPDRLRVVPNATPVGESMQKGRHAATMILCVANYCRLKGQSDLIEAVARLQKLMPVRLVLVGAEIEPSHQSRLREQANALGVGSCVDITGPVTGRAKEVYYRGADVFCLPSYCEGLPMSVLEAMSRGLPVVVTRVGAVPEVVTDGVHGRLYDCGQVDELVSDLGSLLSDTELRERMGKAGRQLILRRYSMEVAVSRLLRIYRGLLGSDRSAS